MNQKKKGAVAVTLLSALLFCLLPVRRLAFSACGNGAERESF